MKSNPGRSLKWLVIFLFCLWAGLAPHQKGFAGSPIVKLLDRSLHATTSIHDGNQITLALSQAAPSATTQHVIFKLDHSLAIGACEIAISQTGCQTAPLLALGWYWQPGGKPAPTRQVTAAINGEGDLAPLTVTVAPRPVVLVHGFISKFDAWQKYLGPDGYLAAAGLQGFAVGDGQAEGVMQTGSLDNPKGGTNTILQNAQQLGKYIQGVKKLTGAEMVDLVGHSMGGMISRQYIDQQMQTRDVAQLVMLGSPMGGSDCANLPAALGFYLPASLEIRPSYMREIFNLQITHRKGVPFHDLAGTPILEGFKSPCTAVPSDLVVSLDSVNAIPLHSTQSPVLHLELNVNSDVFNNFVLPLLQTPAGELKDEPDAAPAGGAAPALQFTQVYTGTIPAGGSQELTININQGVSVASFALFDRSRSLNVRVRGASGKEIVLTAKDNGLVVVDDPRMMFYLGYGFNNPKPGAWVVRLEASDKTPAAGAEYALSALFTGGPTLNAQAVPLLPAFGNPVRLKANIQEDGANLPLTGARAFIQAPDGTTQALDLPFNSGSAAIDWTPARDGLYAINLYTRATAADGRQVDRTAFLTVEVQPANPLTNLSFVGLAGGLVCLAVLVLLGAALVMRRLLRKPPR